MMKQMIAVIFVAVALWIVAMISIGKINNYMRPMPVIQKPLTNTSNTIMVETDKRDIVVDKLSYMLFLFRDPVIPDYTGVSLSVKTNADGGLKLYDSGIIPTEAVGIMQYGAIVYAKTPGKYRIWIEKIDYKGRAIEHPYEYIVEVKP